MFCSLLTLLYRSLRPSGDNRGAASLYPGVLVMFLRSEPSGRMTNRSQSPLSLRAPKKIQPRLWTSLASSAARGSPPAVEAAVWLVRLHVVRSMAATAPSNHRNEDNRISVILLP